MADANIPLAGVISDTSPIRVNTLTNSAIFSTRPEPNAATLRNVLRLEMDGKVVIIDYDNFMERFVPPPPGQPKPRKTRYSAIRLQDLPLKPESAMYPDLVRLSHCIPWTIDN